MPTLRPPAPDRATSPQPPADAPPDARHRAALRARFMAGERMNFICFWGHRPDRGRITASCLSQWYESPFVVAGQRYPTAEHFMMAEKAALFGDDATRIKILRAPTPGAAKSLGRTIRGFDEAAWAASRFDIVVRANTARFGQNPDLARFLSRTAPSVLVEASPVDPIWGIGLASHDPRVTDPSAWRGLNLLGFALMQVRGAL